MQLNAIQAAGALHIFFVGVCSTSSASPPSAPARLAFILDRSLRRALPLVSRNSGNRTLSVRIGHRQCSKHLGDNLFESWFSSVDSLGCRRGCYLRGVSNHHIEKVNDSLVAFQAFPVELPVLVRLVSKFFGLLARLMVVSRIHETQFFLPDLL